MQVCLHSRIRIAAAYFAGLAALVLCLTFARAASAQAVSTTTVTGTIYLANGAPASGSVQVSWPAFTTAAGQAVAAGRTSTQIGADGFVSLRLAPNLGAMPAGLFYTAVYHLNDGTTSTEYWVVPAAGQATIGQIRAQVMPAAQAVQAVSKAYVDQSINQAVHSQITPSGGTLTGPLYLSEDPSQPNQAATKHYVDQAAAQDFRVAARVELQRLFDDRLDRDGLGDAVDKIADAARSRAAHLGAGIDDDEVAQPLGMVDRESQ